MHDPSTSFVPTPRPHQVVLVHGLFMGRPVMQPLARRLRSQGHAVRCFGYNTVAQSLESNIERLVQFAQQAEGPVTFVGHSLGGIVSARAALTLAPGTVRALALLGSPVRGSQVGRRVHAILKGRGPAKHMALWAQQGAVELPAVPLFTLVGTRGRGLGQWLCRFNEVHDGTVALSETVAQGAMVRKLPVSHTGMLFDLQAAAALNAWLATV